MNAKKYSFLHPKFINKSNLMEKSNLKPGLELSKDAYKNLNRPNPVAI